MAIFPQHLWGHCRCSMPIQSHGSCWADFQLKEDVNNSQIPEIRSALLVGLEELGGAAPISSSAVQWQGWWSSPDCFSVRELRRLGPSEGSACGSGAWEIWHKIPRVNSGVTCLEGDLCFCLFKLIAIISIYEYDFYTHVYLLGWSNQDYKHIHHLKHPSFCFGGSICKQCLVTVFRCRIYYYTPSWSLRG